MLSNIHHVHFVMRTSCELECKIPEVSPYCIYDTNKAKLGTASMAADSLNSPFILAY